MWSQCSMYYKETVVHKKVYAVKHPADNLHESDDFLLLTQKP